MALVAPTFFQDPTDVAGRDGEYTDTPCSDVVGDGSYNTYLGCNRAGSNAPGLGLNPSPTPAASAGPVNAEQWTVLDQHEAARSPQDGQQIGGVGFVDRSSVAWPSSGGVEGVGDVPINILDTATPDVNNTCVLTDLAVGWVNTAVV